MFCKNNSLRIILFFFNDYNFWYFQFLAYFMKAKADINLILVNWEKPSQTINYIAARNRVEPIGEYVATLIDFLVSNDLVSLDDINVIGFSLGLAKF